jgi:hypothetical protein
MKFDAPEKSPAHLALLMAATDAGVGVDALRRLLWLIAVNQTEVIWRRDHESMTFYAANW